MDSEYSEENEEYEEYEDYNNEENEARPEFGAHERVGVGMVGLLPLDSELPKDPTERFITYVNAISLSIKETNPETSLGDEDIRTMLTVEDIKNIEHKNPTAYVLGYIASNGGTEIKKKNASFVFEKILPNVQDISVKPADVIRYARYWINMNQ
jgi:hypothetical protein